MVGRTIAFTAAILGTFALTDHIKAQIADIPPDISETNKMLKNLGFGELKFGKSSDTAREPLKWQRDVDFHYDIEVLEHTYQSGYLGSEYLRAKSPFADSASLCSAFAEFHVYSDECPRRPQIDFETTLLLSNLQTMPANSLYPDFGIARRSRSDLLTVAGGFGSTYIASNVADLPAMEKLVLSLTGNKAIAEKIAPGLLTIAKSAPWRGFVGLVALGTGSYAFYQYVTSGDNASSEGKAPAGVAHPLGIVYSDGTVKKVGN